MFRHKLPWIIAVLLVCLAAAGWLIPRLKTTDASWEQALKAMAERDYPRAQRHLIDYVVRWDRDSRGHVMLARCYRQAASEDLDTATEHLLKAGRLSGTSHDLELEADLLEFQEYGGPPETQQRLEAHLNAHASDAPLILEALARGCLRGGRLNSANQWLDRWIREYPEDWWARMWRGSLFQHMGRPQLAIEDFQQVLAQRPDHLLAVKHLGQVLATSGYDYDQAEQLLLRYLDAHPDDVEAVVALALAHHARGQLDAAETAVQQALRVQPRHVDALRLLAQIQLDRAEYPRALETLDKFESAAGAYDIQIAQGKLLVMDPVLQVPHETQRAEEALHLRGAALRGLGRDDEAAECVERLDALQRSVSELKKLLKQQKERERDPDYLAAVTQLYLQIGQPLMAREWLQQLFQLSPDDARIQTLRTAIGQRLTPTGESPQP